MKISKQYNSASVKVTYMPFYLLPIFVARQSDNVI